MKILKFDVSNIEAIKVMKSRLLFDHVLVFFFPCHKKISILFPSVYFQKVHVYYQILLQFRFVEEQLNSNLLYTLYTTLSIFYVFDIFPRNNEKQQFFKEFSTPVMISQRKFKNITKIQGYKIFLLV